jgi:hypothetical protein
LEIAGLWPDRSYYGGPQYSCDKCGAFFWFVERANKDKNVAKGCLPVYSRCCLRGKVSLPGFADWPSPLKELLRFDGGPVSSHFLRLIRHYNSMFTFTSLGADVDRTVNSRGGPYVFKICGTVYHRIGSLLPLEADDPRFAQLYMVDTADELDRRMDVLELDDEADSPDRLIVRELGDMLDQHNPLVHKYRLARRRLQSGCSKVSIRFFGGDGVLHGTRYSGPSVGEVAALIVGDLTPEANRFDVIVETASRELQHVSSLNPSLMALQYPLLFPYGHMSYHLGIKYIRRSFRPSTGSRAVSSTRSSSSSSRRDVSMLEFYSYYIHYRADEPNPYTCCGRLSQQIIVNAYSCVEANRLSYHFFNQDALRSETYQGISDAMGEGSSTGRNIGVQYILHSSFTGGPRYMAQNYQDGIALCRVHGAPDLFITFTCNPKWQEVADALVFEPGQSPADRPDIVTRVFHMKYMEFLTGVKTGDLFGPIKACEFLY